MIARINFRCMTLANFIRTHPVGTEVSAESFFTVLQTDHQKVYNRKQRHKTILAEEIFHRVRSPHQNRLDFFAPLFVSRKKVEKINNGAGAVFNSYREILRQKYHLKP